MSTRGTIAYEPGRWHLYHEATDLPSADGVLPVYLQVHHRYFEAVAHDGGHTVTVALPADLAAALLRGLGKAGADGKP